MALYEVDLQQFGIIAGHFEKDVNGHYSIEQYTNAYNNGIGIQNAIDYARDNGYTGILLPKNIYTLCYHKYAVSDEYTRGIIYLRSNQELNLGASTIEIMYDSTQKSPYHTIDQNPWLLSGWVFATQECHNAKICNGEIKGDIYNRSFTDTATGWDRELAQEGTYGVVIYANSHNITIENLNIHGFMGDSITMTTRGANSSISYFVNPTGNLISGYINSDGTITPLDGAFYSENIITIDRELLKQRSPLYPNIIQLQTGGGYTRIPDFKDHYVEIAFYRADSSFIRKEPHKYLDKIVLPFDATGLKLQLIHQDLGTSMPYPNIAFTGAANSFITVRNCKIHDNHRGGISSLADNSVVEWNDIYSNGMDSSIGAPLFPDSTRYAINCEDSVGRDVVIRNNNIYHGFNGLLMGCYNSIIEGNIINNIGGVIVYNSYSCIIKDNKFYNSNPLSTSGSKEKSNIIFENNIVENEYTYSKIPIYNSYNILIINNVFKTRILTVETNEQSKVIFKGNYIESRRHPVSKFFEQIILLDECFNNYFKYEDLTGINSYFAYKEGGNNVFENFNPSTRLTFPTKISYKNDKFINCNMKAFLDYNKDEDFEVNYFNCEFINSELRPHSSHSSNRTPKKSSIYFRNCSFQINDILPIRVLSYVFNQINFYVKLENCVLNYVNETVKPKLIYHGTGAGRLFVEIYNTKVNGNDNFENLIV